MIKKKTTRKKKTEYTVNERRACAVFENRKSHHDDIFGGHDDVRLDGNLYELNGKYFHWYCSEFVKIANFSTSSVPRESVQLYVDKYFPEYHKPNFDLRIVYTRVRATT